MNHCSNPTFRVMPLNTITGAICTSCGCLTGLCQRRSPHYLPEPPSKEASTELLDFAGSLDSEVDLIDEHINILQTQLEKLKNARLALALESARLKNQVSPINRLPDEMLVEIFQYCVPESPMYRIEPLLAITHICRRWRGIAVSEPRIWTCVVSGTHQPYLDLYLSLSKDYPLTIICHGTMQLEAQILARAPRWKTLVAPNQQVFRQLQHPQVKLPMLRHLFHSGCPQQTYHHALPRQQITHFSTTLSDLTSDMYWVLVNYPNIVSLEAVLYYNRAPLLLSLNHTHITHLGLRTSCCDPVPLNNFLESLTFPALQTLRFEGPLDDGWKADPSVVLKPLISRSSCGLRELSLVNWCPSRRDTFMELCEFMPELRSLHIKSQRDCGVKVMFMEIWEFFWKRCLLPNLRALRVEITGMATVVEYYNGVHVRSLS